jgi:hypothetical protein
MSKVQHLAHRAHETLQPKRLQLILVQARYLMVKMMMAKKKPQLDCLTQRPHEVLQPQRLQLVVVRAR